MKIAIISDIHSNLEALEACYQSACQQDVEKFICLGDCVGYGPDPVAVIDKLRSLPGFTCVLGNHDEYMFNSIDVTSTAPVQQVAEWTIKQLSDEHLEYLKSLPYVHIENGVSYVHSTLYEPNSWAYITRPEQALKCMNASTTNVVFYGHVHVPMIFHEKPDSSIEVIEPQPGKKIPLNPNRRYVINVGSVGQPRDDNNQTCYVIYDEETNHVVFHRLDYDYKKTIDKMHANGLHEDLAERLKSGS